MKRTHFILSIISCMVSTVGFSQSGNLDLSFDVDGKVSTSVGSDDDIIHAMAIQPDGKIVVAGSSVNGSFKDFAIARYDTDGSLDNSFSADGKVIISVDSSDDIAYAVAIQSDGKIVIAGNAESANTDFIIVRLLADGNLDNSFDGDGILISPIGPSYDYANSLMIQPDGKILVSGHSMVSSSFNFSIARYLPDGSLDTSFSGDGKQITSIGPGNDMSYGMAIQQDGKILVTGRTNNGGTGDDFATVRYNSNGTLDLGFDSDGMVITPFGADYDVPYEVNVQADHKIVVAGCTFNGTDDDFLLVRYKQDGSLDSSFGAGGMVNSELGADDWIFALMIQQDGKLVVAGYSGTGSQFDFALARYHINGDMDTSFSNDGIVITDFIGTEDMAYAAAIQPDLKIVAAGYVNNGTDLDFALARYISGLYIGLPDFGENNDIRVYPNPIHANTVLSYTLLQPAFITIELVDANGRFIQCFVAHEMQEAGEHELILTLGDDLPSGEYFLILSSPNGKASVKMVK